MRSLWRQLALQWLGGEGSDALTRDRALLDLLIAGESGCRPQSFAVTRRSAVSHQAMMSPLDRGPANLETVNLETVVEEKYRSGGSE